ncbi:phospholipase DDHD1 isoform X3 [Hemicordylus capensis]|uniref:phospholipase DDHD1 isoform X3 n=1 Tax=Hemicordylus capensis TaxID=884348 RepID=UPI002303950E|nr:phospholipase DDHD1 isoform X3 [Hemicordylus capensis]
MESAEEEDEEQAAPAAASSPTPPPPRRSGDAAAGAALLLSPRGEPPRRRPPPSAPVAGGGGGGIYDRFAARGDVMGSWVPEPPPDSELPAEAAGPRREDGGQEEEEEEEESPPRPPGGPSPPLLLRLPPPRAGSPSAAGAPPPPPPASLSSSSSGSEEGLAPHPRPGHRRPAGHHRLHLLHHHHHHPHHHHPAAAAGALLHRASPPQRRRRRRRLLLDAGGGASLLYPPPLGRGGQEDEAEDDEDDDEEDDEDDEEEEEEEDGGEAGAAGCRGRGGLGSSESAGSLGCVHGAPGGGAAAAAAEPRKRPRGTVGPGGRAASSSSSSSVTRCYEVVRELGPEEVRWFYREDRKIWKPFIGYDSLRIELAYRALLQRHRQQQRTPSPTDASPERQASAAAATGAPLSPEPVCVRSGLYEVDVASAESYPVYWNQTEKIPVMRGQWFIDGTWQPLEEEESNLIEQEHLSCFKGQQLQENFDMEVSKPVDGKEAIHSLKLSRNHVDWHSVDEVYLYSDATTSKIARTVTQKLGFSKASSSGTRLHRGYVEEATLEDKPSPTTHIVFVVHGIGQKMDQGRIIKNTAMMRDTARKIEDKYFSNLATHVEFLPVEWRSKLALDGDTVDSITPDKVRGLRDMLNSSAMDIMYYTSPLYRDELVKGLQQELNRLYTLFCSRNPEFKEKGGKVSIVSHSLGCVITYDIMTGWNPVRLYEQLLEKEYEDLEDTWMTYEEQHLLEEFYLTKQRLRKIEERLHELKTSTISKLPALKFKVENFFCMGSPLAVFLALRGIRPGNSGSQDHILPRTICNRLLNIFHPTDPVAYRLEPLILKHYSNISPVQIHWYNTTNPLPYEHMKLSFLNPTKEPTSASESEPLPTLPSPTTSPVMTRRHYGESITNIGKELLALEKAWEGYSSQDLDVPVFPVHRRLNRAKKAQKEKRRRPQVRQPLGLRPSHTAAPASLTQRWSWSTGSTLSSGKAWWRAGTGLLSPHTQRTGPQWTLLSSFSPSCTSRTMRTTASNHIWSLFDFSFGGGEAGGKWTKVSGRGICVKGMEVSGLHACLDSFSPRFSVLNSTFPVFEPSGLLIKTTLKGCSQFPLFQLCKQANSGVSTSML